MSSRPRLRKFALTTHVVASVGWLGAVVVFLALSVVGLTAQDPAVVRAAYLAMESIGWLVLVPLSVASLVTGLVQSRGTKRGLFVHYWIVMKLAITVVATIVLLLYMRTLEHLAGVATQSPVASGDLDGLRSASRCCTPVSRCCCCSSPRRCRCTSRPGMTRYGQRKQRARRAMSSPPSNAPAPADSV